MLPRQYRFHLRSQRGFFEESAQVQTRAIRWFVEKIQSGDSQGAIVVPKTTATFATRRNAIKRRLHEALLPFLKNQKGVHVVGIVKKNGGNSPFDFYEDIKQLDHSLHS